MKTLADCQIVMAFAAHTSETRSRAGGLERAGARVRCCTLSQDLWSTVSDGALDAILVLLTEADPAALAIYDQLRGVARTRGILSLLLTEERALAGGRPAILLGPVAEEPALIDVLGDLLMPVRQLRDTEQQERALREQLRRDAKQIEDLTREQAERAHESRAMLSAILGFACNLRDEIAGPMSTDQQTHVKGIIEGVERAAKLLERPRGQAAPATEQRSSNEPSAPPRGQRALVHLARLASEVVSLFEAVAARKGMKVRSELDESVCVWGEPLKLKQVVTNLLVNALKYTPAGGQVTVRVRWSAPGAADGPASRRHGVVEVADTGPGIAPEHRSQIFRRGFRIGAVKDVEGEGIGLSVVQEIVALHGGSIAVGGEVGRGAVFQVRLPQDRRQRARSGPLNEL